MSSHFLKIIDNSQKRKEYDTTEKGFKSGDCWSNSNSNTVADIDGDTGAGINTNTTTGSYKRILLMSGLEFLTHRCNCQWWTNASSCHYFVFPRYTLHLLHVKKRFITISRFSLSYLLTIGFWVAVTLEVSLSWDLRLSGYLFFFLFICVVWVL